MKTYLVGGAVRDALMGLPVCDRDFVVVGSSPQEMLAAGFLQVGKDFPVFLHPQSREEYALARTERKTAPGYSGFAVHAAPDVTLEQDLARRDLTINSIAVCADSISSSGLFASENSALIDPYHGQRDIANKTLRHVTSAFREDPVRILRVARFAARFTDFNVAPETMALMREMVLGGEASTLVAERIWQELSRGLMEAQPSRMFAVLRESGALKVLLPEVDALFGVPQRADYHPEIDTGVHVMMVLNMAAQLGATLPVRWACLMHDLGKATTPKDLLPRHLGHEDRSAKLAKTVAERLRVPTDCKELADVVAREHGNIHQSAAFGPAATVRLLERCDAFRKPARFAEALWACECDARGRLGLQHTPYPQRPKLLQALTAAQEVATDAIAANAVESGSTGPMVGQAIHAARVEAVANIAQAKTSEKL